MFGRPLIQPVSGRRCPHQPRIPQVSRILPFLSQATRKPHQGSLVPVAPMGWGAPPYLPLPAGSTPAGSIRPRAVRAPQCPYFPGGRKSGTTLAPQRLRYGQRRALSPQPPPAPAPRAGESRIARPSTVVHRVSLCPWYVTSYGPRAPGVFPVSPRLRSQARPGLTHLLGAASLLRLRLQPFDRRRVL